MSVKSTLKWRDMKEAVDDEQHLKKAILASRFHIIKMHILGF